ncbi:MAG: N-6 DNA methylase [Chloroflexota bacterium]|nr:N-6 DNA methylase [Chloroflexota bacterium]
MLSQADARRNLDALLSKYYTLSEPSNYAEKRAMSESSVVRQFIDILLRDVLGWPIEDPARYQYELVTIAGRPDMTLTPESGGTIFVEAKRFGVIKPLQSNTRDLTRRVITPAQMSLPGITTDRTEEEQQAINYAFKNNGEWAILTNFEVLRLFNARRDWLVLSFEEPAQYRDEFDILWQLAYPNVLKGSLEALSNQRVAPDIDREYLAFINTWREKLALDLMAQRDKNPWLTGGDGRVDLAALRSVVQQFLDRLVVMRFAEDWLVINPGTMRAMYEMRKSNPYSPTMRYFLDNLFRRFDEDHNSALFAQGLVDKAVFNDDTLLPLIEKLYEVRYRAMPADILGNTYEQYLGKALALDGDDVRTRDNLETRKKQGSYYTPQVIVRYLVRQSLGRALYGTEDGTPHGTPVAGERRRTTQDVASVRVLDSACGSGSFLIEAYYVLKEFYELEIPRIEAEYKALIARIALGDAISLDDRVAAQKLENELKRLQNYPRVILETHIYGVDLDPQAAEVAVVNLIMRAMERSTGDRRLPLLLNQNIKVGNGLVGLRADDPRMAEHADALAQIAELRARLVATPHGTEHDRIIVELKAATDAVRAKLDAHITGFSDLERVKPFHWGLEFPEVFYGGNALTPGFTVIIGNPPWEIVMPEVREYYAQFDARIESQLNRAQVDTRVQELDQEHPERRTEWIALQKAITESAAYYRRSGDYKRQGTAHTATHKLFLERMWGLLTDSGRLGYVIPSGIYTDLGTKDLRQMLLDEGAIQYLFSFSNERFFFNGVHHSFKFCLLGTHKGGQGDGFWATFRFNPRVAVKPDDLPAFIANKDNLIYVKRDSIQRFSPESLSVMEFQTARDYAIAEKIYADHPLVGQKVDDTWNVKFNQEFNMTNDRHLFRDAAYKAQHDANTGIPSDTGSIVGTTHASSAQRQPEDQATQQDAQQRTRHASSLRPLLPLYQGRMIHQFDAFYGEPEFWIADAEAQTLSAELQAQIKTYRVVHRRIARATDARTLISAIVPRNAACEVNATVVLVTGNPHEATKLYVCALLNSFVLDYLLRYKVSTTLNMFYMESLPLPRLTAGNPFFDAIVPRAARLVCTRPEFDDLWREVMGDALTPSPSPERGVPLGEGSPEDSTSAKLQSGSQSPQESLKVPRPEGEGFRVRVPDRQQLRDEIDALVAHLYGLTRDEFDHILGTFPLVFPDTDDGRAKRARLLAVYDAWMTPTTAVRSPARQSPPA